MPVTAYTPTTTQPITNYIPVLETASAGVARFDHNPLTFESLGLLVEEQRTNLVLRSEEFDNAAWVKTRSSITANTIVAPDGTLTGDKIVEDTTANSTHLISQSASLTPGVYTYSFFAKAAERGFLNIGRNNGFIDTFSHSFNLTAATATGTGCSIQSVGNGWYRCIGTFTVNTTGSTGVNIQISSSGTSSTYTGDGYSGIYIWGAQLEAGAFPTSYIKTVASQVTRSPDSASMTGANFSSWYAGGQGTVYSEHDVYSPNSKTQCVWDLTGGATSISLRSPQATTARLRAFVGGVFSGAGTGATITANTFIKATVAWDGLSGRLQSGSIGENVTAAANLDATQFLIGSLGTTGSTSINGHIRKLAFYQQRLTNTQLQAITG